MSKFLPVISVFLAILLSLGAFFLWWPKYQEYALAKAELKARETDLEQKKQYFAELESIASRLNNYGGEFNRVESALPRDVSLPDLFNYIQNAAAENGLAVKSLGAASIGSLVDKPDIKAINFSLAAAGSYPALKNFMDKNYRNSRILEVLSLTFGSPASGGEGLFNFNLVMQAHVYQNKSFQSVYDRQSEPVPFGQ